jgi:glycosyltransferase involved in cell wall biosynthesis
MPLAKYLTELGHSVDLYCLMNSGLTDHFTINLSGFKLSNGFVSQKKMNSIIDQNIMRYLSSLNVFKIYLFSKRRMHLYINYFFYILSFSIAIRKKKYDIIHFIGQIDDYYYFNKLLNTPKIFTFHEVINHSNNKEPLKYNLVSRISKKENNIILHSSNTKEDYIHNYQPRNRGIHVIKFGLFETYKLYKDDTTEESRTILYYGIIQPYKGIEYLIQAFQIIKKEISDIKLIIAGRGHIYFDKTSLNDENIEFINRSVSEKELVYLNKRATLVVCPYTSASQSGIPVTSFNFLKPIVASNVDGISEYVIDGFNGLLVPPRDSISLAKKITQLLVDDKLRNIFKKNILQMNIDNQNTWNNIAKQTVKVYLDEINSTT